MAGSPPSCWESLLCPSQEANHTLLWLVDETPFPPPTGFRKLLVHYPHLSAEVPSVLHAACLDWDSDTHSLFLPCDFYLILEKYSHVPCSNKFWKYSCFWNFSFLHLCHRQGQPDFYTLVSQYRLNSRAKRLTVGSSGEAAPWFHHISSLLTQEGGMGGSFGSLQQHPFPYFIKFISWNHFSAHMGLGDGTPWISLHGGGT